MVYAPSTETKAETFLWHDATLDLKLGIAHLYEQNTFRLLGSYQLIRETATRPSAHISVGVQGIGTGNPGWTGRLEKNFRLKEGNLNVFGGIGLRGNEDHAHPIAGGKFEHHSGLSAGVQWEGHAHHPFVIYAFGQHVAGLYLIGGKSLGYMAGTAGGLPSPWVTPNGGCRTKLVWGHPGARHVVRSSIAWIVLVPDYVPKSRQEGRLPLRNLLSMKGG